MPQHYALDYLELPTADGATLRQFMTQAFGWEHTDFGPHYTAVHAGLEVGIDSSERRVASPMPVIRAEDLEAAERDVVAAGGAITMPAYDFPGGRRFHCRAGGIEFAVYIEKA